MKLQLGQIIIWDGYQQIVTAVSETHARIATRSAKNALTKTVIEREQNEFFGQLQGKPVSPESEWADNLLAMSASLGDEAIEFTKPIEESEVEISLEPKKHRLEIGNAVLFFGHKRVVVHSEKSFVKLLRIDGEVLVESNPLECVKFQPTATVNLETFLSAQGEARTEITKQITAQEKEIVMTRKKTESGKSAMSSLLEKSNAETAKMLAGKPTGATKKPAKAAKSPKADVAGSPKPTSKGRCGSLFGFSVVAVMKTAGKAGTTYEQAKKVLDAHGLKAAEGTVKRNLRLGVLGVAGPELTAEQLNEFLA